MAQYAYATELAKNGLAFTSISAKLHVPRSAKGYLIDVLGWIDNPERYIDSAAQLVKILPKETGRVVMTAVTDHIAIYTRDPEAYTKYVATLDTR